MLACLLFSFNRQFNVFFNLWRIDDWKPRIKKIKIWQVNWREQVELLKRRLIKELRYYRCYQFYYFFKMALSNFNTRIFSTLKHLSFFKTKLVSHSIKVRSHCNFVKPFVVYVVKIMEGHVKKVSNFRCVIQVS